MAARDDLARNRALAEAETMTSICLIAPGPAAPGIFGTEALEGRGYPPGQLILLQCARIRRVYASAGYRDPEIARHEALPFQFGGPSRAPQGGCDGSPWTGRLT